jgi:hypothetical protein
MMSSETPSSLLSSFRPFCLAFLTTTFVSSVSDLACFASSRLLSSVKGGTLRIMLIPLLEGAKPKLN